jgi:hypothetical protein
MTDLVVTVPRKLWTGWLAEGDLAGQKASSQEWAFYVSSRPPILPGERLYIVAWDRVRGFAPVTRVAHTLRGYAICRRGGAQAVTIEQHMRGFRGFRARWWPRDTERPFPDWMTAGTPAAGPQLSFWSA